MHINHLTMMKIESIIPPKKYRYVFPFIDYRFNLMMYPSGAYMYILDRATRMRVVSSVPWCRHAFWACYSRKQFNRVWSLKTSLVVVCAYGDCKCPQLTRTNSSTPRRRWCGTATSLVASLLSDFPYVVTMPWPRGFLNSCAFLGVTFWGLYDAENR